jgi:membrane fusion protein (multidrug efflux system)
MNKSRKKIYFFSALVIIVFIGLVYFRIKGNLDASTKRPAPQPSVQLSSPVRKNIENKLSFTGDIIAIQQANIYSRVAGNLKKIYVDIGRYVRQGQLLAEIDKSIYYQNVKQTEGLYKQAKATYENNKLEYDRNLELFDKGLVSQSQVDNAKTSVTVSEAQMESALANYTNAQTQLSFCDIRAPFSGYITKKLLDAGTYVVVGGNNPNSVLFVLSDIDNLKVMVNVQDKDIPLLDKVESAVIKTDAYPDEEFTGHIKAIGQSLDLSTRTMQTEVDIENHNQMLKPGMFASVDLILKKEENAITLPIQCIQKDEKGNFVFMVNRDSVAYKKYVQLGIQDNNTYEISDGLGDSDKVVILGQDLIKDGMRVKITK